MKALLGIDIGTSSTKSVLLDIRGNLLGVSQSGYAIDCPHAGWAEQHPETWWEAVRETVRSAVSRSRVNPRDIAGIGLSGQMHGTVLLDKDSALLRPAIIWADRRSAKQCAAVVRALGKDKLRDLAGNSLSPGFLAATLLWLKENEPQTFSRVRTVFLPKDFIRFKLTDILATEVTDASSSLLLDVKRRAWSNELLDLVGISCDQLPPLHESQNIVGQLTRSAAEELGILNGIPVVAGGGDQSMAAIGNGVVREGSALSTIGTGGQLFSPTGSFKVEPELRVHSFCHAVPGMWHLMGAILSAGLSLNWFRDGIAKGLDYKQIDAMAAPVPPGSDSLIFLPYLLGERTPHLDPSARACFIGLTNQHTLGHLARSIMEGVAFAMKDCLCLFQTLGVNVGKIIASGGGATSALWRQIQADIYGQEVFTVNTREAAATGSAIVAGVGAGEYRSIEEACASLIKLESATLPNPENTAHYAELYEVYRSLYPLLREPFHKLTGRR